MKEIKIGNAAKTLGSKTQAEKWLIILRYLVSQQ